MQPAFRTLLRVLAASPLLVTLLVGCANRLESIQEVVMIHSGKTYWLLGPGEARVLVAPGLQGRVLTTRVGDVESVGFVNLEAIEEGEADAHFNNFGGQDRFWLGPEAGPYGLYFEPGSEITRDVWRVPAPLNEGGMTVTAYEPTRIFMNRDMEVSNYSGTRFKVRVERDVGVVPPEKLNEELGVTLPEKVSYMGSFSLNKITNIGEEAWKKEAGLPCIWILGQFAAGPRAVVIAPFRPADSADGPPPFNDDYFGKVSEVTPERITTLGNAVLFKADARREGKFGLPADRVTEFAGSFDPEKNLLVVVKFDIRPEEPLYASFSWDMDNPSPYRGDVFQSYNADSTTEAGRRNTFYELESVAPCRELAPGESMTHRHATFCFQGERAGLGAIAREVLGVELDDVLKAMP